MVNKRGEVPWVIIGVILAIAVLVLFIFGLGTGTNPLFGAISNYGGGAVNIQQIVQSCQIDCSTQSNFNYCSKVRDVTFVKGEEAVPVTCYLIESRHGLSPCTSMTATCGSDSFAALDKKAFEDDQKKRLRSDLDNVFKDG